MREGLNSNKKHLIDFHWGASAVCSFLKNTSNNLEPEFLDKLNVKYGTNPSVLFAFGQYHSYTKDNSNIYFKMGYEFKYSTKLLMYIKSLLIFMGLIIIIFGLIIILIPLDLQVYIGKYLINISIFTLIVAMSSDYIKENHFKWAIKKHLKKYKTSDKTSNDSYIYDTLVDDLIEVY